MALKKYFCVPHTSSYILIHHELKIEAYKELVNIFPILAARSIYMRRKDIIAKGQRGRSDNDNSWIPQMTNGSVRPLKVWAIIWFGCMPLLDML